MAIRLLNSTGQWSGNCLLSERLYGMQSVETHGAIAWDQRHIHANTDLKFRSLKLERLEHWSSELESLEPESLELTSVDLGSVELRKQSPGIVSVSKHFEHFAPRSVTIHSAHSLNELATSRTHTRWTVGE